MDYLRKSHLLTRPPFKTVPTHSVQRERAARAARVLEGVRRSTGRSHQIEHSSNAEKDHVDAVAQSSFINDEVRMLARVDKTIFHSTQNSSPSTPPSLSQLAKPGYPDDKASLAHLFKPQNRYGPAKAASHSSRLLPNCIHIRALKDDVLKSWI